MQLLCLLSSLLLLGHSCASLALNTYALYLRSVPECAARANRPSLGLSRLRPLFSSHHEVMAAGGAAKTPIPTTAVDGVVSWSALEENYDDNAS